MLHILLSYVSTTWNAVLFLRSPVLIAELAAAAAVVILLRILLGGFFGWLLRTAIYLAVFAFTLRYGPFQAMFSDVATPIPLTRDGLVALALGLVHGQYPGYVVAALLALGFWLPTMILGAILRALFGSGEPDYEPAPSSVGAAATPGQPFDIRRKDQESKQAMTIMMTDIAGYSAKMEKDETATYALLKEHNVIMRRNITTHRGKEIKTIGDAFMVTFANPLDALRCGISMQKDLHGFNKPRPAHDQLRVRIGIHQGEVIATGKDVFGEGVNIAARMESITEPGGISISEDIYAAVKNKVEAGFLDIGTPKMKNIANPPKVYRVQLSLQ